MPIFFSGLMLGLSLIMSLGPQNIFLIKQGAQKNYAVLSASVCFICDVILISSSVIGLSHFLESHPDFSYWFAWFGAAFLLYYAFNSLKSALRGVKNSPSIPNSPLNRYQIIVFALGFSLLNPYAILDTLIIVGSGSSQYPDHRLIFAMGVITASLIWFGSITITSQYFSTLLKRAAVWKSVELISGSIMVYLGIKLMLSGM